MTRNGLRSVFVLTAILATLIFPLSTFGFATDNKWPDTGVISYQINPNLDLSLGVQGAPAVVRSAASYWHNSSAVIYGESTLAFDLSRTGAVTPVDFRGTNECAPHFAFVDYPDNTPGRACLSTSNGDPNGNLSFTKVVLNSSPTYRWNIGGPQNNSQIPNDVDIGTVVAHELGHTFFLGDSPANHPEATMSYNPNRVQPFIMEDDKRGATMLYGPYTGFDTGRAEGIQYRSAADHTNYATYKSNVVNWFNAANTVPLMEIGAEEFVNGEWVSPWAGTHMMRVEGTATAYPAYVYYKLFSIIDDSGRDLGTKIVSGTHLKWCQYNFQQRTFGIDAYFSDGTSLRTSAVVDQFGRSINPAVRLDPLGAWYCYDADLTPVAGKTVLHWYIAYDNRSSIGELGKFRAYFDSVKLVWPGGKP